MIYKSTFEQWVLSRGESIDRTDLGEYRSAVTESYFAAWNAATVYEYGYASRLAIALHKKHFAATSPEFKLLDTLSGVLTQIDNMTCGMKGVRE